MFMVKNSNKKILLVNEDEYLLISLSAILKSAGYIVKTVDKGEEVIELAKEIVPDMIILDVILPDKDGIEICHELRQINTFSNSSIIFYSGRAEDYTQIAAFSAGADDYIVKPVRQNVLLTRLAAHFRKMSKTDSNKVIHTGDIRLDVESYSVFKQDQEIILARKEFELLLMMLSNPQKVFTRDEIYKNIWGGKFSQDSRTIDVHIRKIREKIGNNHIKTIKGVGYSFVA
jgi:two-component system, OmpR family, alkaline phosphatase synthesis response regulator PhoP